MKKLIVLLLVLMGCTRVELLPESEVTSISVKVFGRVEKPSTYTLEKGSTWEDLRKLCVPLEDADLTVLESDMPLFEGDVIEVKSLHSKCISINTANKETLMEIKGVGAKTAEAIISYREQYGLFHRIEELMNIKGIGEKKLAKMREQLCL